jgi:dinuclear metal center YbgI/SA1388 family protein
VAYLDDYLGIASVPDYPGAYNGLQVEGTSDVRCAALAVDACLATIEEAVSANADVLVVHHGLFWTPPAPIVGLNYRRLAPLFRSGMALYSAHLPLDLHPDVGNNHVLTRMLGLEPMGTWALCQDVPIGVITGSSATVGDIQARLDQTLGCFSRLIGDPTGPAARIGIVTGGGADSFAEASRLGLDLVITGEAPHHAYHTAVELDLSVLLAGHYATETVGVKALGQHLANRFGLETLFIDHPTGL